MGKKIGRKIVGYVAAVTIVQLLVFHHYNALFSSVNRGTPSAADSKVTPAQQAQKQKQAQLRIKEVAALKTQNYKFITVSPAQDYATYVDSNNVLHIEDLKTGKDISAAKNPYTLDYVSWIENPQSSSTYVLIGEEIQPGDLELKTVDISDGSQQIIAHFSGLASNAAIQKVVFSFETNQIYILVNTDSTSAIYHIGTMKHVTDVPIGGRFIKNIALSQTTNRLYFEDRINGSYNVLYFDNNYVPHRVQLNAALVTVVGNTLYYGKIDKNGLVTAVYKQGSDGNSTLVQTLGAPTLASDIDITQSGDVQINSSTQ